MRHAFLGLAIATLAAGPIPARSTADDDAPPGPSVRDPEIVEILEAISADRIKARVERLAAFGTRHTLSATDDPERGIGAARRWIESEFRAIADRTGGRLKVELDSYEQEPTRRIDRPVEIVNVRATLPGRDPDRYLVVGGHYDSRASGANDAEADAPGANDDASGTAVVMELAEVMASHQFDATIVFAAYAGEEQGLFGSTHHARVAAEAGLKVEAMITNDIVGNTEGSGGRRDNRTLRVFSEGMPALDSPLAARLRAVGGESDAPSRQLARYIEATAEGYLDGFDVKLVFRSDRYLRGGDHLPFLAQGYPAVRFTEPSENFERQHQDVRAEAGVAYGDVPEKVDYPYVADVARVNAATLASLALAYRSTLRAYTGDHSKSYRPAARKRTKTAGGNSMLEKSVPFLTATQSVVAMASLRSMLRAPEAKMALLTPLIFACVFGSMLFTGGFSKLVKTWSMRRGAR